MPSNKKAKEYVKNTLILMLGKFCTQFMSFLLLPLYTRKLAAGDFGTIDLIQTYIILFVPIFTLRLDNAVFRFLIDCRDDKKQAKTVISNVFFTSLFCVALAAIIFGIVSIFTGIPYGPIVFSNLLVLMLSNVLLQVLRGQGKIIKYSIASVITGVSTLLLNILFVVLLNHGAESILISSSIANALCILFVCFSAGLFRNISIKLLDGKLIKRILRYSIPLIPHSLSWWVVNVSDRTIISIFLGAASNGIYAISCKISNIINSIFSIFGMSWQESASLHIDDPDRDEFFTKMINKTLMLFASGALLIMAALPIFYDLVIGNQYLSSYNYIPVLLYANVWSALTGLIGGIYVAKKRTKEIANTTIVSAIINIAVDLVLIHFIGLYAATISTLVSTMAMAIYRSWDCRKYVKYKFDILGFSIFSLLFIGSAVLYHINNPYLNIVNIAVVVVYVIIANRHNIKSIIMGLNKVKNKITRKEANERN